MLSHVRDKVFPFIKNLHNGEKSLFAQQMKDAVFIIPKPSLLQEADPAYRRYAYLFSELRHPSFKLRPLRITVHIPSKTTYQTKELKRFTPNSVLPSSPPFV
jgi:hypothetical protein